MNAPAIPRTASRLQRIASVLCLGLLASPAAAGELEIEWRAPAEPVQGFVIERRAETGVERELLARLGPEARSFVDDAAPAGALVCYRVRAILRDGSWAPSEEQCALVAVDSGTVEAIDVAAPAASGDPVDVAAPAASGDPVDVAAPAADVDPVGEAAEAPSEPAERVREEALPDVSAPGPEPVATDRAPAPAESPESSPRVSDRFRPVPAERFLGEAPESE